MNWLTERAFAHRGLHDQSAAVPENSVSAFEAACQADYGIELDVQLSRDGQAMVFHDSHLERLTGRDAEFCDLGQDEIAALRLEGTDQKMPTLEDVLKLVAGRVPLLVEVKNERFSTGPLERAVADLLKSYRGNFAVISFNPLSVAWFARHRPDFLRGQSATHFPNGFNRLPRILLMVMEHMVLNFLSRPNFIVYDHRSLTRRGPRRARRRGLKVVAFTIKTEAELSHARQHADNVIFENVQP